MTSRRFGHRRRTPNSGLPDLLMVVFAFGIVLGVSVSTAALHRGGGGPTAQAITFQQGMR